MASWFVPRTSRLRAYTEGEQTWKEVYIEQPINNLLLDLSEDPLKLNQVENENSLIEEILYCLLRNRTTTLLISFCSAIIHDNTRS